jgi:hypothetical protein
MMRISIISLIPERRVIHLDSVNPENDLNEIIDQACKNHAEICEYYDEQVLIVLNGSSIYLKKDEMKQVKLKDLLSKHGSLDNEIKLYITPILEGG